MNEDNQNNLRGGDKMNKSDEINELTKALCVAQSKMDFAEKDNDNSFFKSKYADLTSIIRAAKDALSSNGLAISQVIEDDAEIAKVTTLLLHTSGQWISSTVALKPKATDPQAMGSAITYARRYGYAAIIGLSADDDDGNAASQPGKTNGNQVKKQAEFESKSNSTKGEETKTNNTPKKAEVSTNEEIDDHVDVYLDEIDQLLTLEDCRGYYNSLDNWNLNPDSLLLVKRALKERGLKISASLEKK